MRNIYSVRVSWNLFFFSLPPGFHYFYFGSFRGFRFRSIRQRITREQLGFNREYLAKLDENPRSGWLPDTSNSSNPIRRSPIVFQLQRSVLSSKRSDCSRAQCNFLATRFESRLYVSRALCPLKLNPSVPTGGSFSVSFFTKQRFFPVLVTPGCKQFFISLFFSVIGI